MSNLENKAQHLSPGSVWESLRGSRFTVLAVTNLTVATDENAPKRRRELFPLSVVFLNEENDIFSCNAESFLKAYDFVYNDEVVDNYMSQVYAANVGELGPVDRKKIEEEQKKQVSARDEETGTTLAQQMLGAKYNIKFLPTSEEVKPMLTSEALAEALTSYSVSLDSTGNRFYKFVFATNHVVNHSTLNATFNPEVYGEEENTYQKFTIESDLGVKDEIAWNTYCGLSLEVINQESFIALILADLSEAEPVVEAEPEKEASLEDELARLEAHVAATDKVESSVENAEHPVAEEPVTEEKPATEEPVAETVTEVQPQVVQEELPTEAPIEVVDEATVTITASEPAAHQVIESQGEDLNLDDNDLVMEPATTATESSAADVLENEQGAEPQVEEATVITADEDTPHTLRAQLATTLAKQILSNQNK